jgi:DNA-nicking Smr family endonuclease
MKPPATAEADLKLWGVVTATVRPLGDRNRTRPSGAGGGWAVATGAAVAPAPPPAAGAPLSASPPVSPKQAETASSDKTVKPPARHSSAPAALEPGRRRRLERGRDAPAGVIDLHGLNQDEAREALTRFVTRGFAERRRTLLVITGKGALGDGVLRRRVPEWLGQAPLRPMIAGLSEAHRRHGGEGALYVALRRG